ncbi:MAG TPA: hypothetical protein VLF62_01225 [Candidatus Saccharimonadales bacterium]|nr:hypothetical protein [Candidatus Saccharimonadales bacterium]
MAGGENEPPQNQEQGSWSYRPEGSDASATTSTEQHLAAEAVAPQDDNAVTWTASEFIAHEKNPLWYVVLILVTVAIGAGLFLLTRDYISVAVVAVLATVFGVAGSRKPRVVSYRVDRGGISVGKIFHPYGSFRSFAVVDEGAFSSITFLPLKRFNLPLSIYFAEEDEHRIMDVLGNHLPLEPGQLDALERAMRNLHF